MINSKNNKLVFLVGFCTFFSAFFVASEEQHKQNELKKWVNIQQELWLFVDEQAISSSSFDNRHCIILKVTNWKGFTTSISIPNCKYKIEEATLGYE